MNLIKYRFWAALVACAIVAGVSAPATGQDTQRRSERPERADKRPERADKRPARTPYSNESVRREREAVRIVREIERQEKPDHYRFRDRRPERY